MRLIERDAKILLAAEGFQLPRNINFFPFAPNDASYPEDVIVKAQVLQGRRGKSGLIKRVTKGTSIQKTIQEMLNRLQDIPCAGFLVEECIEHQEEFFLSIDLDSDSGFPRLHFSTEGGMNLESERMFVLKQDSDIHSLPFEHTMKEVIRVMRSSFVEHDLTLIEINPLIHTNLGTWIALDAKIELDDLAAYRHPEWSSFHALPAIGRMYTDREIAYQVFRQTGQGSGTLGSYLELDGDVAVVLSGGGASLIAMDVLKSQGLRPANYIEMSGNPDPASVKAVTSIVLSHPGIKALWIAGSHANFTDIDATIGAVLDSVSESGRILPILIRRDGPNTDEAMSRVQEWAKNYPAAVVFDRGDHSISESGRKLKEILCK